MHGTMKYFEKSQTAEKQPVYFVNGRMEVARLVHSPQFPLFFYRYLFIAPHGTLTEQENQGQSNQVQRNGKALNGDPFKSATKWLHYSVIQAVDLPGCRLTKLHNLHERGQHPAIPKTHPIPELNVLNEYKKTYVQLGQIMVLNEPRCVKLPNKTITIKRNKP